jgi:hypothetical protein
MLQGTVDLLGSPPSSGRLRVPGVYLALANRGVLAIFALCRINNLHGFNRVFSAIPTAPTNLVSSR